MDDHRTPSHNARRSLVARRPQLMALEQRFVFDGAGAAEVADAVTSPAHAEPAAAPEKPAVVERVDVQLPAPDAPAAVEAPDLFRPATGDATVREASQKASEQIRQFLAPMVDFDHQLIGQRFIALGHH